MEADNSDIVALNPPSMHKFERQIGKIRAIKPNLCQSASHPESDQESRVNDFHQKPN